MCGIAGYQTDATAPPRRELLARMCARLSHRGPDAEGFHFDQGVGLGHRRLSIIDVKGGEQPLANEDGTVQIVFNGEIYNFRDLRTDLERKGHVFRTASDTETIVHLYEDVGERTPEYLNGMFAFAIWDGRSRRLFLARDRFGKKPLYYTFGLGGLRFAFASELKALAAIPGFDAQIDPRTLADYLCLSYTPDPDTIYRGIKKLRPGHAMTVNASGAREWPYWRPEFAAEADIRFEDAVDELHALARDAVERRMISDVPLGAFLSGGVDSSAVVGVMSSLAHAPVETFSIGFTDKSFDELEYARQAAARNNTHHHEQVVALDFHDVLETFIDAFDEPFADSSAIPMLYLARMTRRHVTVALSGDGADEVFGGYRRYRYGVIEERIRRMFPRAFRRAVFGAAGRWYPKFDYLPQVFRARSLLTNIARETGDAYFNSMTGVRDEQLGELLAPEIRRELGGYSPREHYRARFERVKRLGPLEQMQAVDFETYLPGDILVKADRATMAYSLESRSPWLDYRIAELACRLPSHFKLNGVAGKYVFKRTMAPYVPSTLLNRRKMGFSAPVARWFRTTLKPLFSPAALKDGAGGLISTAYASRLWNEHQSGLHNHDRKLWTLLVLGLWRRRHGTERSAFDPNEFEYNCPDFRC